MRTGSIIHDRRGATAIEYALLAAFIAIVIVGALLGLGVKLSSTLVSAAAGFKVT